jgi:hypothetical protein
MIVIICYIVDSLGPVFITLSDIILAFLLNSKYFKPLDPSLKVDQWVHPLERLMSFPFFILFFFHPTYLLIHKLLSAVPHCYVKRAHRPAD